MQEKSFRVVPVPLRMDGYVIQNACACIFDQARMWAVGDVTYTFHLGAGPPPGDLKSRNSTRSEFTMSRIAFGSLSKPPPWRGSCRWTG